jgi:lipid-A-disaccharide synthase
LLAGSGLPAEVHVGRTPEVIESADACVAVSGSVGLELMTRLKPTVVVYRVAPLARWLSRPFMTCRYISLVNLLADAEVFPEYLTTRDNPDEVAGHVVGWLTRPATREAVVARLRELRDRAAVPGACERAAEFLLADLGARGEKPVVRAA